MTVGETEGRLHKVNITFSLPISALSKSITGTLWAIDGGDEDWKIELPNIVNFIVVAQSVDEEILCSVYRQRSL